MARVNSANSQMPSLNRTAAARILFVTVTCTTAIVLISSEANAAARLSRLRCRERLSHRPCAPYVQCPVMPCEAPIDSSRFTAQQVEDVSTIFNSRRYGVRIIRRNDETIVECVIHSAPRAGDVDPPVANHDRARGPDILPGSTTTLRIAGENVTADDWNKFRKIRNIRRIEINNCALCEDDFKAFCSFPDLRELQISGMQIGEAGLAAIVACSKLEVLSLGRFSGWASLKTTPPFPACHVQARLAMIASLTGLRTLNLSGIPMKHADIRFIAALPKLEELDINGTQSTDRTLDVLGGISTLRKIKLRDDPAETRQWIGDAEDGGGHNKITSLAVLRFCDTRPDCKVLYYYDPFLEQCKSVADLQAMLVSGKQLRDPSTGDGSLLRLRAAGVTDGSIRWISKIPGISTLDVSECDITDAGVSDIAKMRGLREINLWGTNVTVPALRALSDAADLQIVWIDARGIKPDELKGTLSVLQHLKTVKLLTRPSEKGSLSVIAQDMPNIIVDVFSGPEKGDALH